MTLIRFLLIMLAVYVLYRFIFHIAIPVFKASRKIHRQFRNMQQQAHDNIHADQHVYPSAKTGKKPDEQPKANTKDYIDFEEIKE